MIMIHYDCPSVTMQVTIKIWLLGMIAILLINYNTIVTIAIIAINY